MDNKKNEVKNVSIVGVVVNLFLLTIKLLVGVISNSQAMIADGLNSAGDIFASIMSYIGSKISAKPSDKDHPYGHGKAEYIFSQIIGLSMIVVAISMIKSSFNSIVNKSNFEFSAVLICVAFITIITKLILFIYTRNVYKRNKSILVKSSMEDHRNDIILTTGTIIGIVFGTYGIYFVDGIIGIMISLWILYVGFSIFKNSYKVLMDTGLEDEIIEDIISIVMAQDKVLHVDNIATKPVGERYVIMIKMSMDGNMTIFESHKISGIIKENIKKKYAFVYDVIIHINPH